jgi:hypothetical protein
MNAGGPERGQAFEEEFAEHVVVLVADERDPAESGSVRGVRPERVRRESNPVTEVESLKQASAFPVAGIARKRLAEPGSAEA